MDQRTKEQVLRGVPCGAHLDPIALGYLATVAVERLATPGSVLDAGRGRVGCLVVLDGYATADRDGVEVGAFGPGSVIGDHVAKGFQDSAAITARTLMHLLEVGIPHRAGEDER
jgi:hypothetical protein